MSRVVDLRMFVAALPVALSVRRALRRHQDITVLVQAIDAAAARRSARRWWGPSARVPSIAGWCFWFSDRSCIARSLTGYALLRRQGESPSFVSGVASLPSHDARPVLDGHAWVELDGMPLGDADRERATNYRENFRYPPST